MTPIAVVDANFAFEGAPPIGPARETAGPPSPAELGPLAQLPGTWTGTGFNAIWRPHNPMQPHARFLELDITTETLAFSPINGPIPNRGLLNPDINMFGLTYMQQVSEALLPPRGLHVEPGIWATVPPTTDPALPATVVRMGCIPHGTSILAQGVADIDVRGAPAIEDVNIVPFPGAVAPTNPDFPIVETEFPELDLSKPHLCRHASSRVTQEMVENPNSVLQAVMARQPIKSHTSLVVSTGPDVIPGSEQPGVPVPGGGTANTAFLSKVSSPQEGNADAIEAEATFWIETVLEPEGIEFLQLQYTQIVRLRFDGFTWPHITVATLVKQ
jgi:hypothetical protein